MIHKRIIKTGMSILLLLVLLAGVAQAEAPVRDTRSWTDPDDGDPTITFSTPELYPSCTSASDRIYTEGVPDNWTLDGLVSVYWATDLSGGRELVPNGAYVIQQTGDLDLTITYPPVSEWPDVDPSDGWELGEIHVDLSIVVYDEYGALVTWVGEDPTGAPATLGPGQDWDVWCGRPPPPELAALGDYVWEDQDRDGIQDADEMGIEGVTVHLLDCAGNILAETSTDASGFYSFTDLTPGDYNVHFVAPDGYVFSPQDQGADDQLDSDADPASGFTVCTTLEPGEYDPTWDVGLYKPVMGPGTGTPGYWMNHPEAWPVEEITIGGILYTKEEAIGHIQASVEGDKTLTLFPALVAAKLNVMVGNDDSCIADTIAAADAWMAMYPVGSDVEASSDAWQEGEPWYDMLDKYNNGELCAPARD